MYMRCSVYLRTSPERQEYIDAKLAAILAYFRVSDEDKGRFLALPGIREMEKILRSVTMPLGDILDYLGEGFVQEWEKQCAKPEIFNAIAR